jgi:hypothetical protein
MIAHLKLSVRKLGILLINKALIKYKQNNK